MFSELLSQIPPSEQYQTRPRYTYIITGKPGCGKTTLASKIANHVNAKLVNPTSALQEALKLNTEVKLFKKAGTTIEGGECCI